jgi:hypothetical protein
MIKSTRYPKLKSELKELAKEIRYWKSKRKLKNRGNNLLSDIHIRLRRRKYEFRHRHIAYCELNGRKREKIERPALDNLPNEKYIEKITLEHGLPYQMERVFKHLCANTQG